MKTPEDDKLFKVGRIIEYVGPKEWLERTLANNFVTEEKPYLPGRSGVVIREVYLTPMKEVKDGD